MNEWEWKGRVLAVLRGGKIYMIQRLLTLGEKYELVEWLEQLPIDPYTPGQEAEIYHKIKNANQEAKQMGPVEGFRDKFERRLSIKMMGIK